ncbi:MAG: hypothetical protein KDA32_05580 [Phycisphaerales bacterium]|nr:hypothetical protein [Phycisphaerales bacterium]
MSAAAVIIMHQRKLVRRFIENGATRPSTAKSLNELGVRQNWIFRRMAAEGVFVAERDGRWRFDESAWGAYQQRQRNRLIVFLSIVLIWFAILMIFLLVK